MSFSRPERGAASAPLVVAILAVAVIGATLYFLNAGSAGDATLDERGSGFQATDPIALQRPSYEAIEDEIPRTTPESDEILKGDLIKYYDRSGSVRFRSREKVAGFNQLGETIYWQPDMQVGPAIKGGKVSKSKGIRRSSTPPKMVMRNGKAVMRPGQTQPQVETGTGDGTGTDGAQGTGAGSSAAGGLTGDGG